MTSYTSYLQAGMNDPIVQDENVPEPPVNPVVPQTITQTVTVVQNGGFGGIYEVHNG